MRHDDDRLGRAADGLGDQILEVDAAPPGNDGGERLRPHAESVRAQLVAKPVGCLQRPDRARVPVRVIRRQVSRQRDCVSRVERRRERRRRQLLGAGDAERGDEQRQAEQKPRAPVETAVDGPLERPRPRPSPLCWGGRDGGHPGL
jgi:hypothetical protein